jgi:hypothetical protein
MVSFSSYCPLSPSWLQEQLLFLQAESSKGKQQILFYEEQEQSYYELAILKVWQSNKVEYK